MPAAPLFAQIADGPPGGRAVWCRAEDGLRLRVAHWPCETARGTILLFPGRTEYIEKYGRTAAALSARGYGTLLPDWRGQGLSDRIHRDAMPGDVRRFSDYQMDVRATLDLARRLDLPQPWHLLGHSMGGAIGLRAAMDGLPVASCAFTAPMWGIQMRAALRPLAWGLSWAARKLGLGHLYVPATTRGSYVLSAPFEGNMLTRDADSHAHMVAQLDAHPELALGGPSLRWLIEALAECRALSRMASPALPCLTIVGTDEQIVNPSSVKARIADWPGARLEMLDGARHEPMMDTPKTREEVRGMLAAFWDRV